MSKRVKRRRKGFMLVIIETLLALIIVLLILAAAAIFLCPLKEVAVEGTDLYTSDEIKGYILDDEYSNNTLYAFVKNKLFPKGDAEFIDHYYEVALLDGVVTSVYKLRFLTVCGKECVKCET